jgi:hypothetical protein
MQGRLVPKSRRVHALSRSRSHASSPAMHVSSEIKEDLYICGREQPLSSIVYYISVNRQGWKGNGCLDKDGQPDPSGKLRVPIGSCYLVAMVTVGKRNGKKEKKTDRNAVSAIFKCYLREYLI